MDELAQEVKGAAARMDRLEARLEKLTQEMKEGFAHTDARIDSLDQSVSGLKQDVSELKQCVNERFDHVYGKLAAIDANMMEVRNILASLVERQK